MPVNTNGTWTIPAFRDLCGPNELAEVFVDYRRWYGNSVSDLADLSNTGLRELVRICYHASNSPDEGRYPRFRCYVSYSAEEASRPLIALRDPVPVASAEDLAQLAPVAANPNCALHIVEEDGALYCSGIWKLTDTNYAYMSGTTSVFRRGMVPGLHVLVDGPGEVRASEGGLTCLLRRGRIESLLNWMPCPPVRSWVGSIAADIQRSLDSDQQRWCGGLVGLSHFVGQAWDVVLSRTMEARHGGAFAIVTEGAGLEALNVEYECEELDLREKMKRFWLASVVAQMSKDDKKAWAQAMPVWFRAEDRLRESACVLADLANVDGCVAVTRDLRVVGFGAEITARAEGPLHRARISGEEERIPPQGFGMRHRSAYHLCSRHPGSMVFVVSQDRALRVFYGMLDRVLLFDDLTTGNMTELI